MAEHHYIQIIGSEFEWAVSVKVQGEKYYRQLDNLDDIGHIGMFCNEYLHDGIVRVPNSLSGSAGMMSNGSRYYQDVGGHIEYATPENTTSNDVIVSEFAGERIVADGLRRFIANQEKIEAGLLRKRVIDDHQTLWGYHINISEHRPSMSNFEQAVQPLLVHYAASLPLFGAGAVIARKTGDQKEATTYRYSHGQKVVGLSSDYSHGTTNSSKPIINLRDEPHANNFENRRVHIVGNDPHISPWAARMAIGTYSLLLIACRQNKLPLIEFEEEAYTVAQRVAYDLDYDTIYSVKQNGTTKKYRAIDIEKVYIEHAKNLTDLNEYQQADLDEWEQAVFDLDIDPMLLRNRSDSIAKLSLIRAKLERNNKDRNAFDIESANIDKEFTTIMRATKEQAASSDTLKLMQETVAGKLRSRWFSSYMPSDEEISHAITHPPTTTRAYTRGKAILMQSVRFADWTSYTVGDSTTTLDPLQGTKRPGC